MEVKVCTSCARRGVSKNDKPSRRESDNGSGGRGSLPSSTVGADGDCMERVGVIPL